MRSATVLAAALALVPAGAVRAAVINVPGNQPTIQAGINAALFFGDEVVVADGTYTGAGNRNLVLNTHITVRSASRNPALCVIDCQGLGNGFQVSGVVSAARIEGFTIANGVAGWGGGISCNNASPTVVNCRFKANTANSIGGGGMSLENGSSPSVIGCLFAGNVASGYNGGGGVWNTGGAPSFVNCVFTGNRTSGVGVIGGAMRNMGSGDPVLTNCTLSANNAYDATALFSDGTGTTTTLVNCVIWGHGPGTSGVRIQSQTGAVTAITYSDVQGGFTGTGNVSANPGLLDADGADGVVGTVDDDVRLSRFSPGADAGRNGAAGLSGITTDLAGSPRFVNDANVVDTGNGSAPLVDMGAYERQENSVAQLILVPGTAATIQAGIDLAQLGDQVLLANGTFTGAGNRDLLITKDIILRSEGGNPASCVIDCGNATRGVTFRGATAAAVLKGITVTHGSATEGGGILFDGSGGTVKGCKITANKATATGGGGIYLSAQSNPRIVNTTLIGNITSGIGVVGGALYVVGGSLPVLANCTLWNNSAYDAGAIYSTGTGTVTTLVNSIVWGNAAGTSGVRIQATAGATSAITYTDVEGGFAGTGNIASNPIFADPDLRVASISPCVDAGSNPSVTESTDYDGHQRIFDGNANGSAIVDMGPFEYGAPLPTGIGDDVAPAVMLRAWPNPARALHHLRFTLDAPGPVSLAVFDLAGRRVRILVDEVLGEGTHDAGWDGRDEGGNAVAPGLYLLRLRAAGVDRGEKLLRLP